MGTERNGQPPLWECRVGEMQQSLKTPHSSSTKTANLKHHQRTTYNCYILHRINAKVSLLVRRAILYRARMSENDAAMRFAYRKGQVARQHGKAANANPYDPKTPYFQSWLDGWNAESQPAATPTWRTA